MGSSKVDLPEYRRERSDHSTRYAPVSVRSKIIEEFQARKGVIILGRSHSSSLDRSSSGDEKMMQNGHSLDRRGKYLDERNYFKSRTSESHYDSPRNLMMNSNTTGPPSISLGTWKDKSRVRAAVTDQYDEEYQGVGNISSNPSHSNKLSPPRVPVSHSKTYDHSKERRDTYDPNRHDSRDPNSAQPKQIEIRYRNGGKTSGETIENPRKAVVKGSRTSRGDFNGEDRINYSKPEVPFRPKLHSRNNFTNSNGIEPVIIPKISEKRIMREDQFGGNFNNDEAELPSQTFYFGQTPPKYKGEDTPSLVTAIGKVRNNEATSQPYRLHPRHGPRKSSKQHQSSSSVVPSEPKIVIVNNSNSSKTSDANNNNNSGVVVKNRNMKIPPKERDQEEVNREFQSELLRAKAKLSRVHNSTYLGDSQEAPSPPSPPPAPAMPGAPPPPPAAPAPPPTLVKSSVSRPRPPVNNINNSLNAREELMLAIRGKGGVGGLRKTGLNNF